MIFVSADDCKDVACQNGGSCVDGNNDYSCTCLIGFEGRHCEVDINECLSNPCHVNADCTNEVGSYRCTCRQGYAGNGFSCSGKVFCAIVHGENAINSSVEHLSRVTIHFFVQHFQRRLSYNAFEDLLLWLFHYYYYYHFAFWPFWKLYD